MDLKLEVWINVDHPNFDFFPREDEDHPHPFRLLCLHPKNKWGSSSIEGMKQMSTFFMDKYLIFKSRWVFPGWRSATVSSAWGSCFPNRPDQAEGYFSKAHRPKHVFRFRRWNFHLPIFYRFSSGYSNKYEIVSSTARYSLKIVKSFAKFPWNVILCSIKLFHTCIFKLIF